MCNTYESRPASEASKSYKKGGEVVWWAPAYIRVSVWGQGEHSRGDEGLQEPGPVLLLQAGDKQLPHLNAQPFQLVVRIRIR